MLFLFLMRNADFIAYTIVSNHSAICHIFAHYLAFIYMASLCNMPYICTVVSLIFCSNMQQAILVLSGSLTKSEYCVGITISRTRLASVPVNFLTSKNSDSCVDKYFVMSCPKRSHTPSLAIIWKINSGLKSRQVDSI